MRHTTRHIPTSVASLRANSTIVLAGLWCIGAFVAIVTQMYAFPVVHIRWNPSRIVAQIFLRWGFPTAAIWVRFGCLYALTVLIPTLGCAVIVLIGRKAQLQRSFSFLSGVYVVNLCAGWTPLTYVPSALLRGDSTAACVYLAIGFVVFCTPPLVTILLARLCHGRDAKPGIGARCSKCGYPTIGLSGSRCPECGSPIAVSQSNASKLEDRGRAAE